LVLVPLALLVVAASAGGLAYRRVDSTLSTVRSVSTPPPQLAISPDPDDILAAGGDPAAGTAPTVLVDTGPAVAALAAAGAAEGGGGEWFGGVRGAASNFADLTRGAAVAAGVNDEAAPALTILVMGVDARPDEPIDVGVRPDVLMVVRLDPVAKECRLLSIPRDTRTELPGYGESKVNHALMVGGIPYQLLVVENLLGIEIDRYALMDYVGFKDAVDHFGGITVNVPKEVEFTGIVIPAGRQELDGDEALAYARYRDKATDGDAGRIRRQWAILRGIGEAVGGRDLVAEVNALLPAVEDHIRTDLTATEMAAIADGYGGHCTAETVEPAMLDGTRIRFIDPILDQNVYYNVVDEGRIDERVAELMGT
jgi:LCP family protein required for cell wall assembly